MKPPAPRLTVTPDHFFKHKPVSLNCGSTGDWTVVRNTSTDSRQRCGPDWGRINGSVCEIEELYSDDNGLYWCERDGHRSAAVNITVHEQRVIEPSTSPPPAPSTLPTSPPASLPRHNPPPLGFSSLCSAPSRAYSCCCFSCCCYYCCSGSNSADTNPMKASHIFNFLRCLFDNLFNHFFHKQNPHISMSL
ncbi:unnamed protein product [Knipowitschia caucasica]